MRKDVDAFSTVKSMRRGGTTCGLKADTAGYWLPALKKNGNIVLQRGGGTQQVIYYRNDLDGDERIVMPPNNLQIVAGNGHARSESENPLLGTSTIYFNCNDGEGDEVRSRIPRSATTAFSCCTFFFRNAGTGSTSTRGITSAT